MTAIKSPLKRELRIKDRSRPVVATLTKDGIEFRRKGTRETYSADWEVIYAVAQKCSCIERGIIPPAARGGR